MSDDDTSAHLRHTKLEDVQAVVTATLLIGLGVLLFQQVGMVAGGTVGIAFLLHYLTGWGFGPLIFCINLPFYWLAWRHMGREFTFRTFAAVALLSLVTAWQPSMLQFGTVNPWYAAVVGGLLIGAGFLMLFRHRTSLGGVGIVALILQQQRGWRAGKVQLVIDSIIVLGALVSVEPMRVLYSLLGVAAVNLTIAVNHRPGRYVAM